jgi:hypothetical protein
MRTLLLCFGGVVTVAAGIAMTQGCSSSSGTTPSADAGGEEEGPRVLACPPATDAGVAAAIEAGVTAKINKPTDGQKFTTTEKVTLSGTGSDPKEGSITDKTRMIWNVGDIADPVKGVNPDGEGPDDTSGPYPAGKYIIRFDVSNKACVTAADSVTITVE